MAAAVRDQRDFDRDDVESTLGYGRRLTKWETRFLETLSERLGRRGLTAAERDTLDKIHDRVSAGT